MLAGNVTAIGVGLIVSLTWSLISPEDYDWVGTRAMNEESVVSTIEESPATPASPSDEKDEKDLSKGSPVLPNVEARTREPSLVSPEEIDFRGLNKAFQFAFWASVTLFVVLVSAPFDSLQGHGG